MTRRLIIFTIMTFGLVFVADAELGDLRLIKRERFVFNNSTCQTTNSCDLKKISYLIEDYQVEMLDGFNYGTRIFSEYETDSLDSLENYVFVQFIKGCVFSSKLVGSEVRITHNFSQLKSDGSSEAMRYTEWTLESYDDDPVYNSIPGNARHDFYRWNKLPGSFDEKSEYYYGKTKPKWPSLYVRDHPGTAFYTNSTAKNISLEFKTCLYKSGDIPESVPTGEKISAKPIYCHQWSSSWIYDHISDKYANPYGVVKACK